MNSTQTRPARTEASPAAANAAPPAKPFFREADGWHTMVGDIDNEREDFALTINPQARFGSLVAAATVRAQQLTDLLRAYSSLGTAENKVDPAVLGAFFGLSEEVLLLLGEIQVREYASRKQAGEPV